ncbi:MAG: VWA domain-containing protein [Chlamydiota bacterium]
MRIPKKGLIVGSLGFSLFFHIILILVLQYHLSSFTTPARMVTSFTTPLIGASVRFVKNFTFHKMEIKPLSLPPIVPIGKSPQVEVVLEKKIEPKCPITYPDKVLTHPLLTPSLVISPYKEKASLVNVKREEITLFPPKASFFVQEWKKIQNLEKSSSVINTTHTPSNNGAKFVFEEKKWDAFLRDKGEKSAPPIREMPLPSLVFSLPSLKELQTLSLSDDFDLDVSWVADKEKGYIFAATLIPKEGKVFPRLRQNFFFLLDRSNSIQKNRLASSRRSIFSALKFLKKEDRFNIFAFDSKVDVLFSYNQPKEEKYLLKAKKFLAEQNLASFFSSSNLARPLTKISEECPTVAEDEVGTIIVFSDGDSLVKSKNLHFIEDWTKKNEGRMNLFAIGLDSDPNGNLLEFFASINKGKRYTARKNRGMQKQLVKLMKTLRYTIAKNISVSFILPDENGEIVFYPVQKELKNLYAKEPYVILGSTKTLQNTQLFLQGKIGDKWVHIKKKIEFVSEKQGGRSLEEQWAVLSSYEYYKKFLHDPNPEMLKKAKELVEPYEITGIFP